MHTLPAPNPGPAPDRQGSGVDPELPLWIERLASPAAPGTETFVLLHGFGGSAFSYRTWAPHLARRGHVVLVDMKGFGKAPKPRDGRYAPADLAEPVLRLIMRDDLTRVTLVGHSLGGGVALHVALGLGDAGEAHRLQRLILMAGAAYMQPLPPFVTLARHPRVTRALLRTLGHRTIVAQALRAIVYDPSTISDAQIRGYSAPLVGDDAEHALLGAARQIVPPNLDVLTARYPEIRTPTLLLWGRHDRAVPLWVGRRLAAELPAARLHVLERCGHLPAEELPEESWDAVKAFLDDTGGAGAG